MTPEDLCPRPDRLPPQPTEPLAAPIFPSAVYRCHDPQQAADLLAGNLAGYVYSRDGHPNADLLAEKCRRLHGAEKACVTATGMAALSAALAALLQAGDHVIVSNQLYGRSLVLFTTEAARMGIHSTVVDVCDPVATAAAFTERTRLMVVETITNPTLRVPDLSALAEQTRAHQARLLVDNTFAGPIVCRPMEWGADLVMESLTKSMNGHSDVNLGVLCGQAAVWERIPLVLSAWGLASPPFECWLASRGLGTFALRCERACLNALEIAEYLAREGRIATIYYPGLAEHPDHARACRQFGERFGAMITFTLEGGTAAAERFMAAVSEEIPFSPSLGDISTTLSHPESTSHRNLTAQARAALGIFGGTIRLSVGIESANSIRQALAAALRAL